jgi:hypothetical protein
MRPLFIVEAEAALPIEEVYVVVTRLGSRFKLLGPGCDLVVEADGEGQILAQIRQLDEAATADLIVALVSLTWHRSNQHMPGVEKLTGQYAHIPLFGSPRIADACSLPGRSGAPAPSSCHHETSQHRGHASPSGKDIPFP